MMNRQEQIEMMQDIIDLPSSEHPAVALYNEGFRFVPIGHWILRKEAGYCDTRGYCSVCGEHSGIGGTRKNKLKPFCPNCGAEMIKEGTKNER